MRYLQKIVKNGHSSQVTLPRALMAWANLITGQAVVIEALEDKSIRVRAVGPDELAPRRMARVILDSDQPSQP